jgi:hypothetical protein
MNEDEWLRFESSVLVGGGDWLVAQPFSLRALRQLSGGADWCVVQKETDFWDYFDAGGILLFRQKRGRGCWLLHPAREECRDWHGRKMSWRGFLMRHPEVALLVLEGFATLSLLA